jgi:saccharopine dehydrogenase-like NADP-dependent oxidoreductase
LTKAEKVASRFHRTKAIRLDVASTSDLDENMSNYDVVISLVPYIYHAAVIKSAIKHKTQVVTTSYVSEAIKALDSAAREVRLTVLNEVGVDPGVDHLVS